MMQSCFTSFHEDAIRDIIGPCIRPGGLSLTDRAMEYCAFTPGSIVADIGCGACATIDHLSEAYKIKAFGLDPIMNIPGPAGDSFVRGIAEEMPFRDTAFDGIFCECVLSLTADSSKALAEFCRVLRPGGFLVLSDMYARGCTRDLSKPRQDMERLLDMHGFRTLLWEDHTEALKELVVELILNCSSPGSCRIDFCGWESGYYLAVGRKAGV